MYSVAKDGEGLEIASRAVSKNIKKIRGTTLQRARRHGKKLKNIK